MQYIIKIVEQELLSLPEEKQTTQWPKEKFRKAKQFLFHYFNYVLHA
jgi:hypothetical protein